MTEHPELFPPRISYGSSGGPSFNTTVISTPDGRSTRIANAASPVGRWSIQLTAMHEDHVQEVVSFLRARHGALYGFRFFDWADYSTGVEGNNSIQDADTPLTTPREVTVIGLSQNGTQTEFPLFKQYHQTASVFTPPASRRIMRPLTVLEALQTEGSAAEADASAGNPLHRVWVDAVELLPTEFTVDDVAGTVTLTTPPSVGQTVYWAGYFTAPVRLGREADDWLETAHSFAGGRSAASITIVEDLSVVDGDVTLPILEPGGASRISPTADPFHMRMGDGFLQLFDLANLGSDVELRLPRSFSWMRGRMFRIVNDTITGSHDINIADRDGSPLISLAPGETAEVLLSPNPAGGAELWRFVR